MKHSKRVHWTDKIQQRDREIAARERATRDRARDVLSTWCDMIPTWDPPASEGDP
jgi:hypothetical protein